MSEDMLSDVRKKLIQEHKNALVRVPKRLTETYGKTGGFLGMFTGASAGAIWGSSIGIAFGWNCYCRNIAIIHCWWNSWLFWWRKNRTKF